MNVDQLAMADICCVEPVLLTLGAADGQKAYIISVQINPILTRVSLWLCKGVCSLHSFDVPCFLRQYTGITDQVYFVKACDLVLSDQCTCPMSSDLDLPACSWNEFRSWTSRI